MTWLTPRRKFLLLKAIVAQIIETFAAFYGTARPIAMFRTADHRSLFSAIPDPHSLTLLKVYAQ
jgi:hypothetical protein